jgi:multiple sugar transport system permease protein
MTDAALASTGPPPPRSTKPERLGVISWESGPRKLVTVYLPLACFVLVLLFPFYWMTVTAFKPNNELYNYKEYNPLLIHSPTLANVKKLFFDTVGLAIYLAYLVPPSILFIPLASMVVRLGLFDSPFALILTYPTFLIPFCTWLLIGYFKSIPYELEECALIDGASRLQILRKITLPLAVPGLISAGIFAFTLSWNEFIYALAFIQSSEKKTLPVAVLTQLVQGDDYQWGALMAGALFGSIPVALFYSLFVDYYVSSLTGAVKE